jgi:hypothetical protein
MASRSCRRTAGRGASRGLVGTRRIHGADGVDERVVQRIVPVFRVCALLTFLKER